MKLGFTLVFSLVLFFLSGCSFFISEEEQSRITSPDKRVDAVVMRYNAGAMSSFDYKLFLVPEGKKIGDAYPVLEGTRFDDLKLKWKEPRFLEVHYEKGRIQHFKNMWSSPRMRDLYYVTEIRLMPNPKHKSLSDRINPDFAE